MPAKTPDVAFGVALEHRLRPAADVVDVIDLPGRVVQEVHRRGQHEHVVVVGRAAQERGDADDPVADLEPEPFGEETRGGGVVGGAEDGVSELARADRVAAHEAGGPVALAFEPAGAVVRGRGDEILLEPGGDLEADPGAGDRLGRLQHRSRLGVRQVQAGQVRGHAVQVVRVVDADPHFDQAPGRRVHDPQLPAGVAGAEPAVFLGGEAEVGVVGGGLLDVGHAHGDR